MTDERSDWQEHIGVGEKQPRDSIVTDGKRKHTRTVINEYTGRVGGEQIEHRSGRVDAVVRPEPVGLSAETRET